jgi:hypothetical protein
LEVAVRTRFVGLISGAGTVILVTTSAVQAQHRVAGTDVPVRIFDSSRQFDDQRRVALETAAAVMATAGVRVHWTVCSETRSSAAGCTSLLNDTERAVRLRRTSPTWSREEIAPLGDSVVDGQSQSGVLATIYADRVEWMASRAGINRNVLLGRAIAHELGHLLLGAGHTSTGIMRRHWTVNDLRCERPGDWEFTKEQASVLAHR